MIYTNNKESMKDKEVEARVKVISEIIKL